MKKFIIKLAAVTGIIVIIAGISALATEFSLVTLAIVFAAIITETAGDALAAGLMVICATAKSVKRG